MTNDFYQQILNKQQLKEVVPPNNIIAEWATKLIHLLYPEISTNNFNSIQLLQQAFHKLQLELVELLNATKACKQNNSEIAHNFFEQIPGLYDVLNTDVYALLEGDPAARNEFEVIRAYPGFYALSFFRIAHVLYELDVPLIPRILTEHAHSKTGIDIHPAATIGEYFMIDHGTGVVIGETTIIGNKVKIYQGVTLGALSVDKTMAKTKRHPTIEDNVIIYSGATILGGETIVGHHSIIGGNVWLTKSIPPGTVVYHRPEITVEEGKLENY